MSDEAGEVERPTPRVDVLGVGVSAIDLGAAVAQVSVWVENQQRHYVCVTGVHGVMECQADPELLAIHNLSGMTTPDGMPMVWAGRRAGAQSMSRVYGPDLMLAVLERSAAEGWRSFFYGGGDGVADMLAARMTERFPGLQVAGTHAPPFRELTPAEDGDIVDMINASRADLVWVGLSTPKQERWMAAHRDRLNASVLFGVGAAFNIHAGLLPQAPVWMQQRGLEWAYRLLREPKRLWRRYLYNNPRFVVGIARRRPYLRVDEGPACGLCP